MEIVFGNQNVRETAILILFLTFFSIKYSGSLYGLFEFGTGLTRPLDHVG